MPNQPRMLYPLALHQARKTLAWTANRPYSGDALPRRPPFTALGPHGANDVRRGMRAALRSNRLAADQDASRQRTYTGKDWPR